MVLKCPHCGKCYFSTDEDKCPHCGKKPSGKLFDNFDMPDMFKDIFGGFGQPKST
jgi:hypothetical protein